MTILAENKKVFLNYEVVEKFEAGIELLGWEVKSLRKGAVNLDGAYVKIAGREAFLINASISPYQPSNLSTAQPSDRNRKLLLTAQELLKLKNLERQRGQTIVPLVFITKGRKIKLEIAAVRGKKKFDKREAIKKRQSIRDIEREYRFK